MRYSTIIIISAALSAVFTCFSAMMSGDFKDAPVTVTVVCLALAVIFAQL